MRILALCSYPIEAAATRFRLGQFVEPLADYDLELHISPFLDASQFKELYKPGSIARKAFGLVTPIMRRLLGTFQANQYDLLIVQREAMMFGPGLFEWLYSAFGRLPIVLDLDDATYVRYVSPSFGRLGSA